MGRKIPGKKHRGVKDPEQQRAKRFAELENKINAPPKDVNDQSIPKSLERVIKLKEAVKSGRIGKIQKKKKKKNKLICVGRENSKPLNPKAKPEKVVPIFKQKPGESSYRFLNRVNAQTHAFLNETAFEKKFDVQIQRDPQTGRIEGLQKMPKDELDIELLKAKHKNIKKKKKPVNGDDDTKLTKSQKRQQKLKLKKQQKQVNRQDDFQKFKDDVKFGETVHEPPTLTVKPKKADTERNKKPGQKNLLLNSLINNNTNKNSSTKIVIDKSGKRKNLPIGERRQLEKQQSDVVAAYRTLKSQLNK